MSLSPSELCTVAATGHTSSHGAFSQWMHGTVQKRERPSLRHCRRAAHRARPDEVAVFHQMMVLRASERIAPIGQAKLCIRVEMKGGGRTQAIRVKADIRSDSARARPAI